MTQPIYTHRLSNGLMLVGEDMPWLESVAFSLLVPAGFIYDPREHLGLASLTCEMVQRGCGRRNSREFIEDLEMLGADCSASVSGYHTIFSGAMPADALGETLSIHADLVRRPQLPADQFADGQALCMQDAHGIEDDLGYRAMNELRARTYPEPYGRNREGTVSGLQKSTSADVADFFQQNYRPNGAILSIAGKFDWTQVVEWGEELLSDWEAREEINVLETPPSGGYTHVDCESHQTHICVSYPGVEYGADGYYEAWAAVGILSDGMSSRLFTEVREKRGLVYGISANCHSRKGQGAVLCHASSTPEEAQETLDVLLAELKRLAEGVTADELQRLKARIKTGLIMQQESSRSRAGSMAADWFYLERVQSLQEISEIVDGLSCESINQYLTENPPKDFTIVTLGCNELEIPLGIS